MSALEGIRVLELPGDPVAYAGRLLRDLGAEVIKVEPPGGEAIRRTGITAGETSLAFERYHGGKRSVTIDLTTDAGRAELLALAANSDVVLECFGPGYLAELGLGFNRLVEASPALILASVTRFGQTGPRAQSPANDLITLASGHLMHMTGLVDGPPQRLGGEQSLHLPAMYAATGVVFALLGREKHGAQHLDISMQECMPQFTLEAAGPNFREIVGTVPGRWGRNRGISTPYGMFECRDGWVSIVALTARQWDALAAWMDELGDPTLLAARFEFASESFQSSGAEITEVLARFVRPHPKRMLMEEGQRRGVPIMILSTTADLVADPPTCGPRVLPAPAAPGLRRAPLPIERLAV